ncbi:hypothetical protein GJ700_30195 [Duganella sp. FT92W]|uniref:Uncharacterized protein n=1 Tax=Pseudoduganella rivuli TaxID=2666085 RepID=A0A7X2LWH0_9BURK|nr:hypothetical protein [Pseudoduganella rivuli]MRV75993.1 hypothetical protein [Pseudoduganella rivuli]
MKKQLFAVLYACVCLSAGAAEYLGFDLGTLTYDNAKKQLQAANAPFEDTWGYQGYVQDLPSLKVLGYEKFNKYGNVKEAWLQFSPKKVLYKITVQYNDAGDTFKLLKDALDTKYGRATQHGAGFETEYRYRDGKADITLHRNTFGFGNDQVTSLIYVWPALIGEVKQMQAAIEADIKKKNAKKAGADL